MEEIKIGGEFELDPHSLAGFSCKKSLEESFLFSSGRSALMAILSYLQNRKAKTIYVPYYICESVVISCLKLGFNTIFYELTDAYTFSLEQLFDLEINSSIILVNYFGFVDSHDIICKIQKNRPDITIIHDNVQSFWTYKKSRADFSFTSLRKHFAIPEGALIHSNDPNFSYRKNFPENSFYWAKTIGGILKKQKVEDSLFLSFLNEGERLLDKENEITISSKIAPFLFLNTDFESVKKKRLNNARKVYEIGGELGIDFMFEYSEDVIPMAVPIFVKNRDVVRSNLFSKNIFLPIHWPIKKFNEVSKTTIMKANTQLSLVVDQRYSENEMIYQIVTLKSILS